MPAFPPGSASAAETAADAAAGSLITGDFQIELRSVLMDSCAPCDLTVTSWIEGFGVPKTEDEDKPRAQAHGVFASPQYLRGRLLTWQVMARATTVAGVTSLMNNLSQAMAPVTDTDADLVIPLVFTNGDVASPYLMWGKPQRCVTRYDWLVRTQNSLGAVFTNMAVCEFLATDPLIYDLAISSGNTGLGSSSGGLGFPFGFPFGFGTALAGNVVITNAGNFDTFPVITITAGGSGLSGITITKAETGEVWSITLTMAAADVLVVDMARHTVLLNGASRSNLVNRPPSVWMSAPPGNSTWQFGGSGAGSTMAVVWRDAHLF